MRCAPRRGRSSGPGAILRLGGSVNSECMPFVMSRPAPARPVYVNSQRKFAPVPPSGCTYTDVPPVALAIHPTASLSPCHVAPALIPEVATLESSKYLPAEKSAGSSRTGLYTDNSGLGTTRTIGRPIKASWSKRRCSH